MSLRHKFVWTGAGILLVALAQTGKGVCSQRRQWGILNGTF